MHQPGRRERLAPEARHERRVIRQVLREQLDRHVALEAHVEGAPRSTSRLRRGVRPARTGWRCLSVSSPGSSGVVAGTVPVGTPSRRCPSGSSAAWSWSAAPSSSGVVVVGRHRDGRRRRRRRSVWSRSLSSPVVRLGGRRRGRVQLALFERAIGSVARCPRPSAGAAPGRPVLGSFLKSDRRLRKRLPSLGQSPCPRRCGWRRGRSRARRRCCRGCSFSLPRRSPTSSDPDAPREKRRRPGARLRAACSLPVLQALGERVRQPRGPDRRRRARDVIVDPAERRGPSPRGRAASKPLGGLRRGAVRRCPG